MAWQIDISSDSMEVKLDLGRYTSADEISCAKIIAALQEKNIPVDAEVEKHIREALEELESSDRPDGMPVLVRGVGPTPGRDGYFEWSEKFDPKRLKAKEDEQTEKDKANFYERSNLIIAYKGDVLGILHPLTNGESGKDVFGRPITPQPGADFKLEPGHNLEVLSDGVTFVSQCDGEPKLEGDVLSVDPVLNILSDIDFATGNIDYSGDVNIKGDIKDLFSVRAGGDITIEGTVEAAIIECGGSLSVKRGISGKEKGTIKVKKDLSAKYLSNVSVWVQGDIFVDSEIVNTDLNCRGRVVLQRGAIHGGQVTAAGVVETPIIGSPAGVRTVVRAAIDPYLDRRMKRLEEEKVQQQEKIVILMPRAKSLLEACPGQPSRQLKEVAEEIRQGRQRIETIEKDLQGLVKEIAVTCNGTIIVHKVIYPGTVLWVGDLQQFVEHEMTGPVELVIQTEGEQQTLDFRVPTGTAAR